MYAERVLICQELCRFRYTDYDAMEALAVEQASRDPMLRAELLDAPDPAEMAYRIGRTLAGVAPIMPPPSGPALSKPAPRARSRQSPPKPLRPPEGTRVLDID